MLKWPDAKAVVRALRQWAEKVSRNRPEVVRLGFFGSYARGDWGVGSDLDLVIIVAAARQPFEIRPSTFDTLELPVPADILVYTQEEWDSLKQERIFFKKLAREVVWLYPPDYRSNEACE
ncbi:MAG: nucleotidyltransferase domain-containing protein [Thermodesulfobacteriota bacterium]